MKLGAVCRCGIYFTGEENSGKPQLGDLLMKVVRRVIAQISKPTFHRAMGCDQKNLCTNVAVSTVPSGFLGIGYLPYCRVSRLMIRVTMR